MIARFRNIINKLIPLTAIIGILIIWQILCEINYLPSYMLPSPVKVWYALVDNFSLMMEHAKTTLYEAFMGLGIGIFFAFVIASLMERFRILYRAFYPVMVITQTIPTVAIAPLLVLWMGYETKPKVALVVIVTFFPVAVNLLDGFKEADPDAIKLMKAMGAGELQIFLNIKLPSALNLFFAGVRISVSYAIVGAVIAEWLGGNSGLGVFMTRVKKSYAYDKMFAVIFVISAISLILMKLVDIIQHEVMPWTKTKNTH